MLQSSGYFKNINCPYYSSGFCERPHCHFKHVKRDDGTTVSEIEVPTTVDSKADLLKIYSETLRKIQEAEKELATSATQIQASSILTYIPTPKHVAPRRSSVESHIPAMCMPAYRPTPIAQLRRMHKESPFGDSAEFMPSPSNKRTADELYSESDYPYQPQGKISKRVEEYDPTKVIPSESCKYSRSCSKTSLSSEDEADNQADVCFNDSSDESEEKSEINNESCRTDVLLANKEADKFDVVTQILHDSKVSEIFIKSWTATVPSGKKNGSKVAAVTKTVGSSSKGAAEKEKPVSKSVSLPSKETKTVKKKNEPGGISVVKTSATNKLPEKKKLPESKVAIMKATTVNTAEKKKLVSSSVKDKRPLENACSVNNKDDTSDNGPERNYKRCKTDAGEISNKMKGEKIVEKVVKGDKKSVKDSVPKKIDALAKTQTDNCKTVETNGSDCKLENISSENKNMSQQFEKWKANQKSKSAVTDYKDKNAHKEMSGSKEPSKTGPETRTEVKPLLENNCLNEINNKHEPSYSWTSKPDLNSEMLLFENYLNSPHKLETDNKSIVSSDCLFDLISQAQNTTRSQLDSELKVVSKEKSNHSLNKSKKSSSGKSSSKSSKSSSSKSPKKSSSEKSSSSKSSSKKSSSEKSVKSSTHKSSSSNKISKQISSSSEKLSFSKSSSNKSSSKKSSSSKSSSKSSHKSSSSKSSYHSTSSKSYHKSSSSKSKSRSKTSDKKSSSDKTKTISDSSKTVPNGKHPMTNNDIDILLQNEDTGDNSGWFEDAEADLDEHDELEECWRIFNEDAPPVVTNPEVMIGQKPKSVREHESHASEPTDLVGLRRRVAHNPTGQFNHVEDFGGPSASVAPPRPARKAFQSPAAAMAHRFIRLQEVYQRQTEEANKSPPTAFAGLLKNQRGEQRIAHVPNAMRLAALSPPRRNSITQAPANSTYSTAGPNITAASTIAKGERRVAHTPIATYSKRPIVPASYGNKIPVNVRQRYLNMFIDECLKFSHTEESAFEKGLEEEAAAYDRSANKTVYLNVVVNVLKRLRVEAEAGPPPLPSKDEDIEEVLPQPAVVPPAPSQLAQKRPTSHQAILDGSKAAKTSFSIERHRPKPAKEELFRGSLLYNLLTKYLMPQEQLVENGFPQSNPDFPGKALIHGLEVKKTYGYDSLHRQCSRCKTFYLVDKRGLHIRQEECVYHWGRIWKKKIAGSIESRYSCCQGDAESEGCNVGEGHVVDNFDPDKVTGFVKTLDKPTFDGTYGVFALDCEMCYTTQGIELTRVTVIADNLQPIYETMVKPENPILDHNTRFSGITKDDLEGVRTTLRDVQAVLLSLFSQKTILIGHSLESDFKALRLIHNTVVDTSVVFPHRRGPPFKRALRTLMGETLNKIIQNGDGGHDSQEDAVACLELMIWKIKEDLKCSR